MNIIMFKNVTKKLWLWELLVVIALILFLCSCSTGPQAAQAEPAPVEAIPTATQVEKPTEPPEPTHTPLPTSTPVPLPTSTPAPPPTNTPAPTATATPDLQATASMEATQTAENELAGIIDELEKIGFQAESGELGWIQSESTEIYTDEYGSFYYEPFADGLVAEDFVLSTDITWESTSGLAGCGLLFRSEPNFEVGAQYEIAFLRLSGLPAWEIAYLKDDEYQKSITGFVTAAAIDQDQGSTNSYILVAEGGKFTLYINDMRIGSYYDYAESRLEGEFAYAGWQESGETSCEFSNTWIWMLEEE